MTTATRTAISMWEIDKTHSNIDFKVKHLMISTVRGHFREFDAKIELDEAKPENSRVTATVDVASIETNVPDRDAHLRSDDFFNAEKFPKITFESTTLERHGETEFRLTGNLTIRDVTRETILDGEFEGRLIDPWGNDRAAFSAHTEISRKDFNVRWNQALETGGVAVSDKVKISIYVEAFRQAEPQANG
ncbi:MAG TPA: YceI family protein [Dehalococcoidia bacterium]